MASNIVIIGGGPVGQLFAINLEKNLPEAQITIIELRKTFIREQAMLLNKNSIDLMPPEVIQNFITGQGCYVMPPPMDRRGACFKFPKTQLIGVNLNLIETELLKYINSKTQIKYIRPVTMEKLKIELGDNEVVISENGPATHFAYDFLIGADGLKSQVRKTFFGDKKVNLLPETMHGLTMIIKTDRNTRIYTQDKSLPQLKKRQDRVRFFRQSNQTAYLALALTPKEYQDFFDRGEKEMIPDKFKPTVRQYMRLFDIECEKDIDQCLLSMSYFPIQITRSAEVTNGRHFLIGDAAVNTHYFSGLGINLGLNTADQLSRLLPQYIKNLISKTELIDSFDQKISQGADLVKNRVLEVQINYQSLADKCTEFSLAELKELARSVNIPVGYFAKKELCLLLKEELTFKIK
jgi:2-polyprenyl-6-methoxyphenol hydroxylase-like FAD-dependent oxidoreductase